MKKIRYPDFPSRFIKARNIDIMLPPGYNPDENYPVLYMHDGQNLSDPSSSFSGVDWGIDKASERLIRQKKIRPMIIIGIWNTERRLEEYMPQKAYNLLSNHQKESFLYEYAKSGLQSDNYLKFIIYELKSFIDSNFSSHKDHSYIMGSSMGGLISAYALSEYPEIFRGAGCISTHWPAGKGIMIEYLRNNLPKAGYHKIYFDYGTETTDAEYEPYQLRMDYELQRLGYTEGNDWITLKFPGAEHSERAWRERIHIPLEYFFG